MLLNLCVKEEIKIKKYFERKRNENTISEFVGYN